MKTYWYAAGLKGGGVMVFSAPRKYTKITARQLQTRFIWLSKPHASQREAAVFLGQKVGFRNPPQKVTVLHQGKITVQHLSDPKRVKKNPPKKYHEEQLKHYKKKLRSASGRRNKQEIAYYQGMVDAEKASLGYELIRKQKKNPKANAPQFMEVMFQKWKRECQKRHPKGKVQGDAYRAMCTNQEGDRMGIWNGEDGWVA